jgi:acyl carrier protein
LAEQNESLHGQGPERLIHRLRAAAEQRRPRLLMEFLQEQLGARLGLVPAELGPRDNLMDLGMDSLKAIELKTLLETELELELSSSLAFDQPNLEFLTGFLLETAGLTAEDQLAQQLAEELGALKSSSGMDS